MNISIQLIHDLILYSSIIYSIGVSGMILQKRNLINFMIALELSLLGIFLTFIFFSKYLWVTQGFIGALIVLVLGACESSIAFILILYWKRYTGTACILYKKNIAG